MVHLVKANGRGVLERYKPFSDDQAAFAAVTATHAHNLEPNQSFDILPCDGPQCSECQADITWKQKRKG